jgi:hypothetical protein
VAKLYTGYLCRTGVWFLIEDENIEGMGVVYEDAR